MGIFKDRTGQQFNRLTFIKPTDTKTTDGKIVWELLCVCGTTVFRTSSTVVQGGVKSCGCLKRESAQTNGSRNGQSKRKYEPMISSAVDIYKGGYDDGCDFETFLRLSQNPCYYCGRLPHRTYNMANKGQRKVSQMQRDLGDFTYNGLDRLDSSRNHTPDNIVPCCYDCNRAKMAMSIDEFFSHIERVYLHIKSASFQKPQTFPLDKTP
jgi:hypothetical protein